MIHLQIINFVNRMFIQNKRNVRNGYLFVANRPQIFSDTVTEIVMNDDLSKNIDLKMISRKCLI